MAKGSGGTRGASGRGRSAGGGLASRESQIKNSPTEKASIFDANGKELFRNDEGDANSVSFAPGRGKLKGNIYTHNHPSGSSFSERDLVVAATYDVKEMRVVTKGVTYSLKSSKYQWGLSGKDKQGAIGVAWNDAKKAATSRLKSYVSGYKGNKQQALDRADRIMSHMVVKMVAKKFGWEYTKTKTK
jgi:hypothetical protein